MQIIIFLLLLQDSQTLQIEPRRRPLVDALFRLDGKHQVLVTYEGPYFPDSLIEYDVRDGKVTKFLLPKRVSLMLPFSVDEFHADPKKLLERWVAAYEDAMGQSFFTVVDSDLAVHIIPKQGVDAKGNLVLPILDLEVTFPYAERSLEETLQIITDDLAAQTGRRVVPGTRPIGRLANNNIYLGADKEPARSVLYRLLIDYRMTWVLLHKPRGEWVVLNVLHTPAPE